MNKNKTILVVAPHADDETLGCGGTILRYISLGYSVHWLIVTGMAEEFGFTPKQIKKRNEEISQVGDMYGFESVIKLGLPPAALETLSAGEVIQPISQIIKNLKPEVVYTTYRNDAHSDHEIVFDAVMSSCKTFRCKSVRKVFAYETLSETDFGMKPEDGGFKPNVFVDITKNIRKKGDILEVFESEVGDFPFPRSRRAIEALSAVRGVQCGCEAAEAFLLIKEVVL